MTHCAGVTRISAGGLGADERAVSRRWAESLRSLLQGKRHLAQEPTTDNPGYANACLAEIPEVRYPGLGNSQNRAALRSLGVALE